MSHTAVIKTKLKNVPPEIIRRAMKNLAQELGWELTDTVEDYYHRRTKVIAGIRKGPLNIGVNVENKELEIVGDPYLFRNTKYQFTQLTERITMEIQATIIEESLSAIGFSIEQKQKEEDGMVMVGVAL